MSTRNPARSRPLSANVKRLMKMARESPVNPAVEKIERDFTTAVCSGGIREKIPGHPP